MNWTEIAEGVKAKVLDLRPDAVPLVVLQPPYALAEEDIAAFQRAWESVRESAPHARVLILPAEEWGAWGAVGNPDWEDQIVDKVHTAWMAEKQRQGFADHPYHSMIEHITLMPDGTFDPSIVWCCSKPRSLHHVDMVPYDQLDEAGQEDARATVRAVLNALLTEEEEA